MIVDKVTSRQNPLIKRLRSVRQGRQRHLIFIEGIRLVEEALDAQLHIETVVYSDRLLTSERGVKLYDRLKQLSCRGAIVTEPIMEFISDVESPQGIVLVAHLPYATLEDIQNPTFLLIIHQLQDPGNIGTIIRVAEAAGAQSVIVTHTTVDPFNLKALRAAMGSAFRLPVVYNAQLPQVAEFLKKHKVRLVATQTRGAKLYSEQVWTEPIAILLGQEGAGLDEVAMQYVDEKVSLPMAASVESLNVASTASVICYEVARQRGFKF
ncbi:MAG: RNA methyltransferase [Blastocatellia bacterium]|nr:RNA methyltransferase [Blastocatellia bacterium]